MRNYSFKPGRGISLLFLTVFAVFVSLGAWQMRRAGEKEALMAAREQRGREAPVRLDGAATDLELLRYRRVVMAGQYDAAHQFLLDNQIYGQRPGYQVLTPLRIAGSGAAVMVNRGWVPLGADRARMPAVGLAATGVQLSGVVDRFPGVGFKLNGAEVPGPGWPSVVQLAVPERLAERLGYPVLPYQVLLDEKAGEGYVRAWREIRLDPEKNLGYAGQWFLFALTAAVLYLRHGLRAGARNPAA
jgi:surfeit locus 1 family protein